MRIREFGGGSASTRARLLDIADAFTVQPAEVVAGELGLSLEMARDWQRTYARPASDVRAEQAVVMATTESGAGTDVWAAWIRRLTRKGP